MRKQDIASLQKVLGSSAAALAARAFSRRIKKMAVKKSATATMQKKTGVTPGRRAAAIQGDAEIVAKLAIEMAPGNSHAHTAWNISGWSRVIAKYICMIQVWCELWRARIWTRLRKSPSNKKTIPTLPSKNCQAVGVSSMRKSPCPPLKAYLCKLKRWLAGEF